MYRIIGSLVKIMKEYIAKSPDGLNGTYLSVDNQMDRYLKNGWNIYEFDIDAGEEETLIATPEDGFMVERPVFPVMQTIRFVKE